MGVVVVQVGQGGNQFGCSMFEALSTLSISMSHHFFREPLQESDPPLARAVLVDTEPKVVAGIKRRAQAAGLWRYGVRSSFTQDSCSGNNWARGFCKLGPLCQDPVMDLVRREVEMCDIFSGFISSQSLAGGTGAGLGSFLLELLRDEYPSCCILSHCIWPLEGEVSVQYYNALLSIAHLRDLADGLLLVRNEALMSTCRKVLGIQRPSFDDMNEVGARALASILLPAYHHTWSRSTDLKQSLGKAAVKSTDSQLRAVTSMRFRPLPDLVAGLCAHPNYRMLALRATPQIPTSLTDFTTHSWKSHLKQLKQMLYIEPSRDMEEESSLHIHNNKSKLNYAVHRTVDRCLANLLVLRGRDSLEADVSLFNDNALYPIWSVDPLMVASNAAQMGKYDMFASLLSNCRSAIAPASHALSRAHAMYSSKAYVHQYVNYGLSQDVFETSFAAVQDVLAYYMDL